MYRVRPQYGRICMFCAYDVVRVGCHIGPRVGIGTTLDDIRRFTIERNQKKDQATKKVSENPKLSILHDFMLGIIALKI